MTSLHETEVDGVLCFWVDTGRPTLAARLMFRQGFVDEPLHETGWLHLIEHMALHGTGGGSLQVNGSVSALLTSFDAHGPADQVARHLRRLSEWLRAPDLTRLDHERGVLRAESELRGGPLRQALGMRYGAGGPGVASYDEPGLVRASAAGLRARSQRVLTKGNAVLVLDGPPPVNLRLGLADGPYLPAPVADSAMTEFPRAYSESSGLVLSGVVDRSHEATVAADVLREALAHEVRIKAGAAYAPWATYERVDDQHAVLAAGSDVMPELLPRILQTALDVTSRLESGVPRATIDDQVVARLQALRDPYNAVNVAMRAAQAVFDGQVPPTFDELVAEVENTDPEKMRTVFTQLRKTLLLGAPGKAKLPRGTTTVTFPKTEPWPGARGVRNRNWPQDRSRFYAGASGFQLTARDGSALQVPMADLAGVIMLADGTRHVVRRDGWTLMMRPAAWRNGAALSRAIDAQVPADLQLPQAGVGSIPFQRISARRRWSSVVRRTVASAQVQVVLFVLSLLVTVGLFRRDLITVALPFAFFTVAFARLSMRAVLRR